MKKGCREEGSSHTSWNEEDPNCLAWAGVCQPGQVALELHPPGASCTVLRAWVHLARVRRTSDLGWPEEGRGKREEEGKRKKEEGKGKGKERERRRKERKEMGDFWAFWV